jgi:hypothetical protein
MPQKTRLLELALKGLQAERAKIDDEIAQIKSQLNHQAGTATAATAMSTAAAPKNTQDECAAKKENLRSDEAPVCSDEARGQEVGLRAMRWY